MTVIENGHLIYIFYSNMQKNNRYLSIWSKKVKSVIKTEQLFHFFAPLLKNYIHFL